MFMYGFICGVYMCGVICVWCAGSLYVVCMYVVFMCVVVQFV